MFRKHLKRCLSFLMALAMVFSLTPATVWAEEAEADEAVVVAEEAAAAPLSEHTLAESIQERMDSIVAQYGITADMTDNDIAAAIINADGDTLMATREEMDAIAADGQNLTEEEFEALDGEAYGRFCSVWEQLYNPMPIAENTVLSGKVTVTSNLGTMTVTDDATVKVVYNTGFTLGTNYTFTIKNTCGKKATLTFDYNFNNFDEYYIEGTTPSSRTGTYGPVDLDANAAVTLTAKSTCWTSQTDTLTLSNFVLVEAKDSSAVTFCYDTAGGTVTVGGTAVDDNTTMDVSLTDGAALVATANTGYTFLGWVDGNGLIKSTESAFTFQPTEDTTLTAVFAGSAKAWFIAGNMYLFDDLNTAAQKAATLSTSKVVVVANDGTLGAGDYTIPAGVTLLIPYDSANTVCTTAPALTDAAIVKPTAFRTLTMASGANITVNGAISISGTQSAKMGANGRPHGPVGFIAMNSGSTITVNSGANLYAWGYITGSGSVTVKSGGTVYECFQVMDYRGGDATNQLQDNANRVFPLSQYYVQNVEVPMTLEAGATEYCHFAVTITMIGIKTALVPFVGSSGMFNMTSGALTKDYIESTDRLNLNVAGEGKLASYSFKIQVSLGSVTLNSANYVLPINQNITINVKSGTMDVSQDLGLLPGASIVIDEGATCKLTNDAKVIVYDLDDWGGYCGTAEKTFIALAYAPGRTGTRTALTEDASIVINGTADSSEGYIYTTTNGANICSTGAGTAILRAGSETTTAQISNQYEENSSQVIEYNTAIGITPAKLKNADGTFTETSGASVATTYQYINNKWTVKCDNHTEETIPAKDATCTETGLTEGVKCSVCGETITAQEEIPALGHTEETVAGKAATCTETGLTDGAKCSVCGETTVEQEEIAALGHTEETVAGKAATCTETGLTDGTKCSTCGTVTLEQTEIPAKGHAWNAGVCGNCNEVCAHSWNAGVCGICGMNCEHQNEMVVTDPTCTEQGYTTTTCTICGVTSVGEYQDALGHAWKDATCTDPKTCGTCGATEGEANGHNHVAAVTAPTCTEQGYTTYTCSTCGDTYKDDYTDSKGHTNAAPVTENAKPETCGAAGSYESVVYCSVCNVELSRNSVPVPATGNHTSADAVKEKETPATCTTTGSYESVVYCAVCNTEISRTVETVEALGHTKADPVTENEQAATCTETGSYDTVVYCSVCNAEVSRETTTVAASGHTEGEAVRENEVAATCTSDGSYDTAVYCSVCNAEVSRKTETVAASGHSYDAGVVTTAATCANAGVKTYTCSACGDSYTEAIPATGHSYDDGVETTAPTCTTAGVKTFTCATCGDTYTEEIAATGNHADNDSNYKCDVCDTVVGAVAQVGETYYGSLVDAIAAGDEVTLLANVTEEVVVTKVVSIVKNGFTANVVAGEGYELAETESTYVVTEKVIVTRSYKYGQTAQIGLIEPWFLKVNCRVYDTDHPTNIDYSKLTDYGAYFVRASDLDNAEATQDTLTTEDFLNNENVVHCSLSQGTATIDGSFLTASYAEGLYTYEISDSVFVQFYIVEDGVTYYAPIRERNIKSLLLARKDDTTGFPNVLERNVYASMYELEDAITTYRADYLAKNGKIEALPEQDAPTLAAYVAENGAFTSEEVVSYKFGNTAQIVLIEPWGLKVNARVYNDANSTSINYAQLEEYGAIVFYDTEGVYANSGMTAEQLMTCENAYVFSSKSGDAFVDGSYISAIYNKEIYTYMLNSNAYVMFYVKDGDGFHYGDVKTRNVYELANARKDDTTGFPNALERAVYAAMVNEYDAITKYREDYFSNNT